MGDAAGQLTDRLHLLRLPQRFLGRHAPLDLGGNALLKQFVEAAERVFRAR